MTELYPSQLFRDTVELVTVIANVKKLSDVETVKLLMQHLDQGIVTPELKGLIKQAEDLGIDTNAKA